MNLYKFVDKTKNMSQKSHIETYLKITDGMT